MSAFPVIPRYDLLEEVGHGGMSVVYRARDTQLDREVAVKVLHRHLAGRPEERRRFRREAQAVARLRHPNILEIHDYSGEQSDEAWLVSEFIDGPTLRRFADEVGFGLPEIGALVAEQLARALAHAHAAGIIHRDVKPENVMIRADGSVALADFGVARMVDRDERMTMTGALMGSPAHMAPEMVDGRHVDARSDVFSLGTVLYWLVCGRLPFSGTSPAEVLRRISEGRYDDPRAVDPRVSDPLAAVVHRALDPDMERRHVDAGALRADLLAYLAPLGLEDAAGELRRFFDDPPAYKKALRERLVSVWLRRGEDALATGDVAETVRACDRVLALSPRHEGAAALLAEVHRRRRRRRLAAWAAVGAGLLLALGFLGWSANRLSAAGPEPQAAATPTTAAPSAAPRAGEAGETAAASEASPEARGAATGSEEAPPEAPRETPASGAPAGSPDSAPDGLETAAVRAAARPETEASPQAPPEAPAAAPADHRQLRVLVTPYARIYVDGELVAQDIEGRRMVPVGEHHIRLEREGFVPVEEALRVQPGDGPQEIRRRLTPRPARLRVVNDQGAAVSVDGELRGTVGAGGLELPMTFPERPGGGSQYPLTVQVRLEKPGFVAQEREVRLEPGRTSEVRAELEPEP